MNDGATGATSGGDDAPEGIGKVPWTIAEIRVMIAGMEGLVKIRQAENGTAIERAANRLTIVTLGGLAVATTILGVIITLKG